MPRLQCNTLFFFASCGSVAIFPCNRIQLFYIVTYDLWVHEPYLIIRILLQQILDHLLESAVYSESDLRPFQSRIAELRQIVKDDAKNQPPAMIQLIERKLTQCGECFYLTLIPTHTFQIFEPPPFA